MTNFPEWARDMLARFNVPAQCADCGNPAIDELAITGRGRIICRQDVENVREACSVKRAGWRVLSPDGRVIASGPGVTFKPTSVLTE